MTGTVTVGCKIPNGLVCDFRGAVPEKFAKFVGQSVTLRGSKPVTVLHLPGVASRVGGFGLTDVDADFMTAWMELHAGHPAVKNGIVFVETNAGRAAGHAKEHADLKSGYEPINPAKDLPASIEPADKAA